MDVLQIFGALGKPRMAKFKSSSSQNRLFLGSKQQKNFGLKNLTGMFLSILLEKCIFYDDSRLFRCFSIVWWCFIFLKLPIVLRKSLHSFQCPWDFNGLSKNYQKFSEVSKFSRLGWGRVILFEILNWAWKRLHGSGLICLSTFSAYSRSKWGHQNVFCFVGFLQNS